MSFDLKRFEPFLSFPEKLWDSLMTWCVIRKTDKGLVLIGSTFTYDGAQMMAIEYTDHDHPDVMVVHRSWWKRYKKLQKRYGKPIEIDRNGIFREMWRILQEKAHANSEDKGFWPWMLIHHSEEAESYVVATKLALIGGEADEALEEWRKDNNPAPVMGELADVVIRCMDAAQYFGEDLMAYVEEKLEANHERPYKHGKRF